MSIIRRRVRVTGVVQGVSFRWTTRTEAERLGVTGWVRNLPDRSVVMEIQGDQDAVEQVVAWARHGPPGARVATIEVDELALADGTAGFRILH